MKPSEEQQAEQDRIRQRFQKRFYAAIEKHDTEVTAAKKELDAVVGAARFSFNKRHRDSQDGLSAEIEAALDERITAMRGVILAEQQEQQEQQEGSR